MYFFTGCGIFCLGYWLVIRVYAGKSADFAWIWIVLGGIDLGIAGILREKDSFLTNLSFSVKILGSLAGAMGLLLFLLLTGVILRGMFPGKNPPLDYVVVLGAQVKGKKPSRALLRRLQKAYEYAKKHPDTILILSGGRGSGEEISEAACMEQWLLCQGIPGSQLLLEDQSTSTWENLTFSHAQTGCGKTAAGILSNDFHISRALYIAKKAGYKNANGIPAKGDPVMELHYILRENFAFIKAMFVIHRYIKKNREL